MAALSSSAMAATLLNGQRGGVHDVGKGSIAHAQTDLTNTAVIGWGNTPVTFDPASATDSQVDLPSLNIYSALVQHIPGTTEIEPDLATEWTTSSDGLQWTFKLREGVTFHDGTPLSSADVVYTFQRIIGLKRGIYQDITAVTAVEAPDPLTAIFKLSQPFPALHHALTRGYIVNSALVQANVQDDDFGETWLGINDAGSGPYRLVDFAAQQSFTLEKFEEYWKGWDGDHVDRAIFQAIPEETARQLALESGQIDWALLTSVDVWKGLQDNDQIQSFSDPTITMYHFALNHTNEYLKDPNVRKALSLAYDYVGDVEIARHGQAEIARGPVPPNIPFFDDSIPEASIDLEEAKKFMAASPWPDGGFALEIAYQGTSSPETTSIQIFQAGAAELGIEIIPVAMEWSAKVSAFADAATAPAMATIWIYPSYPDPYNFFFPLLHSSNVGNGGVNFSNFEDSEIDELIEAAAGAVDSEIQTDAYNKLQEFVVNEIPYIPVVIGYNLAAARHWLTGYRYSPTHHATIDVYTLSLEERL